MTAAVTVERQTHSQSAMMDQNDQYVGFVLHEEEYGVPILSVHEIIRHERLTRIPQYPDFIDGVLNLRGQVIPVINLRKKFGLPECESGASTRIMVVDIGDRIVGMVVDGVSEVLQIGASEIAPPPPLGSGVRADFISGMGKTRNHLMILLNLDKILTTEETILQEIALTETG